jgi:hypothetical protein
VCALSEYRAETARVLGIGGVEQTLRLGIPDK